MFDINFVKSVLFMFCDTINSYNLKQPCRQHRRYLLSNNSQLTESQIFQLQDEQFFSVQATSLGCEPSPIELFVETHVRSQDRQKGVQQYVDNHAQHFVVCSINQIIS